MRVSKVAKALCGFTREVVIVDREEVAGPAEAGACPSKGPSA